MIDPKIKAGYHTNSQEMEGLIGQEDPNIVGTHIDQPDLVPIDQDMAQGKRCDPERQGG